jgi:ABC-type Co2+ transport system permease subunit
MKDAFGAITTTNNIIGTVGAGVLLCFIVYTCLHRSSLHHHHRLLAATTTTTTTATTTATKVITHHHLACTLLRQPFFEKKVSRFEPNMRI